MSEINCQSTDIFLALDADAPLYKEDGIYKVVVDDGNGPAYMHLPANTEITGVTFPEYDLSGIKIDYTETTQSGAWQSIYGEVPAEVYVTGLSFNGVIEGQEVLCDTLGQAKTLQLTAYVLPKTCSQEVSWRSSDTNIATIDSSGNITVAFTDAPKDTTVSFIATTVALQEDGTPLTDSVTITVQPFIYVESISFTEGADTVYLLRGITISLETEHVPVILPTDATNQTITWSIDSTDVATLVYNSVWKAHTLRGKTAGTVILKATTEDGAFTDSVVYIFHDPYYSDVEGAFLLKEGTYPACGEISFCNEGTGLWDLSIFSSTNGQKTGVTTQYAAIYGDNFYFVSKQENRFVIADKTTITQKKSFEEIFTPDGNQNDMDGRAFLGVDENTGYIGTSGGICVVNFDTLLAAEADEDNVVEELPYTIVDGTSSGTGLYTGQVGTMRRVGDRVFAVQQSYGIQVINPFTHTVDTALAGNYTTLVQSKDGYLWTGTTIDESTGSLGEESSNVLIRIDPWTLETTTITIPDSLGGPPSTWGAWQADAFVAGVNDNKLYWMNSGVWLGWKIFEYDIDNGTFDIFFNTNEEIPVREDYPDNPWNMYGCPFRIDQETGDMYAVITLWTINSTIVDAWRSIKIDTETGEWTDLDMPSMAGVFNALWIFPDNYNPVMTDVPESITLDSLYAIYLGDKITDADNMDAAIIKSTILNDEEDLISTEIWRDSLIITQLREVSKDTVISFTLKANSNGQLVTQVINVTIEAEQTAPSVPGNITAEATETSIEVTWTASTDNLEVAGYCIYLDGDSLAMVSDTTYTITDLSAGTTYSIEVYAVDAAGNISDEGAINVTTTDETAPSAPTNLSAEASETSIVLSWDASSDNIGVTGYVVYLDNDSVGVATVTSYTYGGLTASTEYTLGVEAFDAAGNVSGMASITESTTVASGISDIGESGFAAYPNPFTSYIIVNTNSESIATIYDLSGRIILQTPVSTGETLINTSALKNGSYILKCGIHSLKVVK